MARRDRRRRADARGPACGPLRAPPGGRVRAFAPTTHRGADRRRPARASRGLRAGAGAAGCRARRDARVRRRRAALYLDFVQVIACRYTPSRASSPCATTHSATRGLSARLRGRRRCCRAYPSPRRHRRAGARSSPTRLPSSVRRRRLWSRSRTSSVPISKTRKTAGPPERIRGPRVIERCPRCRTGSNAGAGRARDSCGDRDHRDDRRGQARRRVPAWCRARRRSMRRALARNGSSADNSRRVPRPPRTAPSALPPSPEVEPRSPRRPR